MLTEAELAENVERLKREIGESVELVAATKTVPAETVALLPKLGVRIAGENRVQEILEKFGRADVVWHMIGHLQTNKVKYIVDKVDCIQSVDSVRLMDEIERQCAKIGRRMEICFEINAAGEPDKTGAHLGELPELLSRLPACPHLDFVGIMAMLPNDLPENNRAYYLQMKSLYDTLKAEYGIRILSMGMSGDYAYAAGLGANMVRVGSALFGKREYPVK